MTIEKKDWDAIIEAESNIVVQAGLVNRWLGSAPPALLTQRMRWARPVVKSVLADGKAKGFIKITDSAFGQRTRGRPFASSTQVR